MKKKLTFLLLIFILKVFCQSPTPRDYSQYYFKNFPNSPSTATFLRYGDIQNSEFIGANSPKIPLHTIKDGAIEFPLNLDYISGNGVKVSDEAGITGLGWNIGIPTLTQSVMGYDDFDGDGNYKNLKLDLHYQQAPWAALNYDGKYLESKDGVSEPAGYINAPQKGKYAYYYSSHYTLPVNGIFKQFPNWEQYDVSPDIFTINLLGDKIQFIIENHKDLGDSGTLPQFACLNKDGYKVSYNNGTFNVTAPNGIIYEFGKAETVSMTGIISRNYLLTKVTDTNNNYISLSYNEYTNILNFTPFSGNLNYTYFYRADPPYIQCAGIPVYYNNSMYSASSKYNSLSSSGDTFPYSGSQSTGSFRIPLNYNYQSGQNYLLISEIKGNFGSLKFNYTDRDDFPTKKLSSINVFATDLTKILKSINFNYNYFSSPNNIYENATTSYSENRLKKRLKLTSLNFNQIEQYQFEYHEKYSLPAKNSFAVDYWGYSNGGNNNRTYFLNPSDFNFGSYNIPIDNNYNNNKKNADIGYCTTGALSRIIYPTKGYSIFEYELNNADNLFMPSYSPKLKEGKGLRFKSQSNYDINNDLVNKTEFAYEGGISTNPVDLVKRYFYKHFDGSGEYLYSIISMNSTNNYSASPLSSGDYIGYSKIIKTEVDKDGNNKGKIVTNYSVTPDLYYRYDDDQLPVNIPSTKDIGIDNGLVLQQTVFNKNTDTLKIVKNQYSNNFSNIYHGSTLSMINENLYVCSSLNNGGPNSQWAVDLSVVAHFPIFHKESLLTSSSTTDYINDKKLKTNISSEYNNYNLQSKRVTSDFSGDTFIENMLYTYSIPKMYDKNILSRLSSKEILKNNKLLSKQIDNYNSDSHLNLTSIQTMDLSNVPDTEVTFNKYDENGNIQQYTKKDGIPVSIIWGYKKTLPIAKIEGATYPNPAQSGSLPTDIPQNLIDVIVEASNKDNDPTQNNLTYQQSEELLKEALNTFRNNSGLLKYHITTYTYDPLIGLTSLVNPSGIIEKYNYDVSGRLISITDFEGKILKSFQYNYNINNPSSVFYSNYREQYFSRNNCGSNSIGGQYMYSVSANKYISMLSQNDADSRAIAEVNAKGQVAANQYGTCTPVLSCGFSGNSSINISSGSFSSTGNLARGRIVINSPGSISWNQEIHLGYVNGSCIPVSLKTLINNVEAGHDSVYRQWDIKIYPTGQVTAKLTYGSVSATPNIPVILDFTYNKN